MACLTWEMPGGKRYLVAEGQAHTPPPGAKLLDGVIAWDCATSTSQYEVDAMLEREGVRWGDAIAWTTKKLGIKQCAPCKARQEILNNVSKMGWADTIKQIKETF